MRLVSGVGQGVKDFGAALLDVKGLLKSPEDFGRNLATGSLSLTRSVLACSLQPATCNPMSHVVEARAACILLYVVEAAFACVYP